MKKTRKPSKKQLAPMTEEARRIHRRAGATNADVNGRAVKLVNRVSNQRSKGPMEDEVTYVVGPSSSSQSTRERGFVSLKHPYADETPAWLRRKRERRALRKQLAGQQQQIRQQESEADRARRGFSRTLDGKRKPEST